MTVPTVAWLLRLSLFPAVPVSRLFPAVSRPVSRRSLFPAVSRVQLSEAPGKGDQQPIAVTFPQFTIVPEDGSEATCSATNEDLAAQADPLNAISLSTSGVRLTVLVNGARDNASGHFALTINRRPVFRITRYGWTFRPF
jgi:hypothetical protein